MRGNIRGCEWLAKATLKKQIRTQCQSLPKEARGRSTRDNANEWWYQQEEKTNKESMSL